LGEWLLLCGHCNSFISQTYHLPTDYSSNSFTDPISRKYAHEVSPTMIRLLHGYFDGWQTSFADRIVRECLN
jgi:hypothetical protein